MRAATIFLLFQCSFLVIAAEKSETRDIELDIDEDIERKHKHKKRKKQQQYGPCGSGRDLGDRARSFGFGDKLFGQSQPDYTYINAPVNNYYIGCGGSPSYNPGQSGVHSSHGHSGHGGHGGGGHGNHGHGNHGHEGQSGHSGHGNQGNQGFGNNGNQQFGGFNPYQQSFASNQYYPQNSPVQEAFSAAASSISTALANYISRPRKTQRQIKQLLRPIYRLEHDGSGRFQSQEQIIIEGDRAGKPEDADPHPQVEHPTTYIDTMLHLFRGNIGSGLLAMGDAFKNGGLIFAPIMTAVLGLICVHAQHMLLNCSEEMHRKTRRKTPPGFADTVKLVFANGPPLLRPLAPLMKAMVNTFLCITQLGFCCVYIVFIANNVKMICDQFEIEIDLSIHMILVIIPVLLACMVRNLKYLTPFSTIANVMMAVGVSAVVYEATQNLPPVSSRVYLASWEQLPLYFGTAVYAFEGIGLVLPLRNEMRQPELFQKPLGVLNVGMVCVGGIFITVGFCGYLKWGDDVMGSLTLNLTPGILSTVVQSLIAVAILFTYPLQFYVPVAIIWPSLRDKFAQTSPVVKELVFRVLLVLVTFVLAESIPQLGLFISLVGAVSSTALALMFPPLIELVLATQQSGVTVFLLLKDGVIIMLGAFVFVTGTYESVASIIKAFKE